MKKRTSVKVMLLIVTLKLQLVEAMSVQSRKRVMVAEAHTNSLRNRFFERQDLNEQLNRRIGRRNCCLPSDQLTAEHCSNTRCSLFFM